MAFRSLLPCLVPVLAAALLSDCALIGAAAGHARDQESSRTRVVPVDQAAAIPPGTLIFATIPDRETLRGRFRAIEDSAGHKLLKVDSEAVTVKVPLDQISELAEEVHDRRRFWTGLGIGASIDLLLIGSALWLYTEIQNRTID